MLPSLSRLLMSAQYVDACLHASQYYHHVGNLPLATVSTARAVQINPINDSSTCRMGFLSTCAAQLSDGVVKKVKLEKNLHVPCYRPWQVQCTAGTLC